MKQIGLQAVIKLTEECGQSSLGLPMPAPMNVCGLM